MRKEPTANKVNSGAAHRKNQLPKKYQPNKTDVLVFDAHIHYGLGEERQNELQKAAH